MFDLKQPVEYRGYDFNGNWRSDGGLIYGSQLNSVNISRVPSAGYTEKRALGDGRDASDVYLDSRRIEMTGQVYGETRGECFDELANILKTLNPVLAYDADPSRKGYLPLTFSRPTSDLNNHPSGVIPLHMYVRPLALPLYTVVRDLTGGLESKGMTIPWEAQCEAKDPRLYGLDIAVPLAGVSGGGTLSNRGHYFAPLTISMPVLAAQPAGTFTLVTSGAQLVITIPNETVDQVLTYDGNRKVLLQTKNGITTLRMDLLSFLSGTTHPRIPPGGDAYTWSSTGVTTFDGTLLLYAEAYA